MVVSNFCVKRDTNAALEELLTQYYGVDADVKAIFKLGTSKRSVITELLLSELLLPEVGLKFTCSVPVIMVYLQYYSVHLRKLCLC